MHKNLIPSLLGATLISTLTVSFPAYAYKVENAGGVTENPARRQIRTDSDGRARVIMDDGSEVNMGPSTEISLENKLNLLYGRIRVLVQKARASSGGGQTSAPHWQMRSGNISMGVRGTEFIVEANSVNTLLCTFEGTVDVTTSGKTASQKTVQAGEGVIIAASGEISDPVTMDPVQMDWWRRDTYAGSGKGAPRDSSIWWWKGPTAVEATDPNALYSSEKHFTQGADLWTRFTQAEVTLPRRDVTARLGLNSTFVPGRSTAFYLEGLGIIKSGRANPDEAGVKFQQGFFLLRPSSSHSIALGRQEWNFGDGFIVGRDPWSPTGRKFDGAMGTLRFAPFRLRAFGATLGDRVPSEKLDDFFGGLYLDFSKIPLELYGFWLNRAENFGAQTLAGQRLNLRTRMLSPFFLEEEAAYERNTRGTEKGAVGKVETGLEFEGDGITNSLKAVYVQASGGFKPFFPDSHRFLGVIGAFEQMSDIQRLGGTLETRSAVSGRPVSAELSYSRFRRLGNEVDLILGVEPHPDFLFQLGGGLLKDSQYLAFATLQIKQ